MRRRARACLWVLAAGLVLLTSCSRRPAHDESARLHGLAQRYFQARFDFSPTEATRQGDHTRDGRLENFSAERLQLERISLHAFLDTLAAVDSTALPPADRVDRELLARDARGRLFRLEDLRIYERDPDLYHSLASDAVYSLLKRDFAPLDDRLAAVAEREEQIPAFLEQAKKNLVDPPEIWTRIAIEQAQGTVQFFTDVVPAAARAGSDSAVRARLARANDAAIGAARDYLLFLQTDLLPRSKGDFALGRDRFRKQCEIEEGIVEEPESILARALAAVADNHRRMAEVCRQIDPGATVAQVIAKTAADHPAPGALLDSCRAEVGRLRAFIAARGIVPLPANTDLRVEETPVFERSLTFASTDAPGPLEAKAREAFYYVTPVDAAWPATRQDEYLREFCRGLIYTTSTHEAYPGHYIQGLYQNANPSLVRKLTGSYAYSEGWAHYCEQMMLDEGYSRDPELRLYQLHDALLRLCRAVLTIRMHVQGWSMDQATDWMVREGYQQRVNAEREVKRYTADPLVLSYWWGKDRLLRLRAAVQRREGARFRLGAFHRRFLELGNVPFPVVEQVMLGAPARR